MFQKGYHILLSKLNEALWTGEHILKSSGGPCQEGVYTQVCFSDIFLRTCLCGRNIACWDFIILTSFKRLRIYQYSTHCLIPEWGLQAHEVHESDYQASRARTCPLLPEPFWGVEDERGEDRVCLQGVFRVTSSSDLCLWRGQLIPGKPSLENLLGHYLPVFCGRRRQKEH